VHNFIGFPCINCIKYEQANLFKNVKLLYFEVLAILFMHIKEMLFMQRLFTVWRVASQLLFLFSDETKNFCQNRDRASEALLFENIKSAFECIRI
jgi:hypothetical protein